MTYGILPNGKQQFIDSNGKPLASGQVYYYIPSTTTFKNTYQNSAGTVLNTNPVVLDANGQCIAYGTGSYRQQVYDVYGNLVWDVQVDSPLTSGNQTYDIEEQTFTATSGQTVFTLTTMSYVPGTNNLVVFVDGLKQIVGVNYTETSATVVTFTTGLHVGAVVDFTTAVLQTNANIVPATDVTYNEGGTGAVNTTVQAKLQESVSVKDFGAVGNGTTDDTAAIQAALNASTSVFFPAGKYLISSALGLHSNQVIYGVGPQTGGNKNNSYIVTNTAVSPAMITSANNPDPVVGVIIKDLSLINNAGTACINVTDATTGLVGICQNVSLAGSPCVVGTGSGTNPVMNFDRCNFQSLSASASCISLTGNNTYNDFTVTNSVFNCGSGAYGLLINCTSGSSTALTQGISILNNVFETANGGAIKIGSPYVANIVGNYFDDAPSATQPVIYLFTSSGSNYHPACVNIIGNYSSLTTDVSFLGGSDSVISGNRFASVDLNGSNGIYCVNNQGAVNYKNSNATNFIIGSNSVPYHQFPWGIYVNSDLSQGPGVLYVQTNSSTTNPYVYFQNYSGNQVGSISTNSANVSYNTSSDRRLKSNISTITSEQSGPIIDALQPRAFTWNADGSSDVGFIADEIQKVIPKSVTGEPNATIQIGNVVDSTGKILKTGITQPSNLSNGEAWVATGTKPVYQMLDASQPEMIAYLVAEMQSLRARLKAANIA